MSALSQSLHRINTELYRFKRPTLQSGNASEMYEAEIIHHVEKRDGKFPDMEELFYAGDKETFYKELFKKVWG
jgi:hypothetical protein